MQIQWTDEMIDALKMLLLTRQSAREIGRYFNISRNAVIGKVHRSGLQFYKPKPKRNPAENLNAAKRLTTMRIVAKQQKRISVKSIPPVPRNGGLTIMELTAHTCRWPTHDDPFLFCGALPVEGSPYCAAHTGIAYGRERL